MYSRRSRTGGYRGGRGRRRGCYGPKKEGIALFHTEDQFDLFKKAYVVCPTRKHEIADTIKQIDETIEYYSNPPPVEQSIKYQLEPSIASHLNIFGSLAS